MTDPARDYVHSQFSGPLPAPCVPYSAPEPGWLRCCECGMTVRFQTRLSYEEQCACPRDECLGQLFCHRWPRWNGGEHHATS